VTQKKERGKDELQPVLTIKEVSERWQLSIDRVGYLINTGKLKAFNIAPGKGRRWRITLQAVRDFEEQNQNVPPPVRRRRRADNDVIEFFKDPE
jgi:hypothetical protein